MELEDYKRKRDFKKTTEPEGGEITETGNRFIVHEHHASRLHFDLRIEMGGALKSWAIPKGPSMNPADKRLAVMVEDHPLEYITFRGEIAEGNYGAGRVEIWDSGTYKLKDNKLEEGKLVFELFGTKLKGQFTLVRIKGDPKQWLLIKGKDDFADPDWKLEQIVPGGSRVDLKQKQKETQSKDEAGRDVTSSPPTPSDPMPTSITPMLAILVDQPFSDPEWLYELKWDGYRAISFIEKDSFRFMSRNNKDMVERFPQSEAIPGLIKAETAIIDGEIVAIRAGKPNFQMLQNAAQGLGQEGQLVYYAFDLLYLDGEDLRNRPLIERKKLLASIIRPNDFLRYSDHIVEHGERLYEQAAQQGFEGIIAKRTQSPYLEKRSNYWLKIKAICRQEVVIGGYTRARKSRPYFGALVVGTYEGDELKFGGHVGGGFDDATLKELYERMQPLIILDSPFIDKPKTNEPVTWLKPELVCEIKYTEWTDEGILRQPVFLGLRADKPATEVTREPAKEVNAVVEQEKPKQPSRQRSVSAQDAFERNKLEGDITLEVDGVEVSVTSLEKLYWPDDGYTKGDLLRYYYQVREYIIPHLKGRPLILKRYPNGIKEDWFYQHNFEYAPEFFRTFPITEEGATVNYAIIDDAASLLYIANLGCIAQNPFSSRVDKLENPDWIVIDLDPEHAPFQTVCEVAMVVKDVLEEVKLHGYPKTSGARGMHIFIPISRIYTYEQTEAFAEIVARIVASRVPKIATIERMKKERAEEQVYVDFQQNMLGKSMTSVYSPKPEPGATVSTPLTWEEVESKIDKNQFTIMTVPERIAKVGDIFHDVLKGDQRLTQALKGLEKLLAEVNKRGGR